MGLLRIAVAVVVTVVWTASYGKSILVTGAPTPPPELSGIMLGVVTWLFASAARAAGGGKGGSRNTRELREAFGRWLLGSGESKAERSNPKNGDR